MLVAQNGSWEIMIAIAVLISASIFIFRNIMNCSEKKAPEKLHLK